MTTMPLSTDVVAAEVHLRNGGFASLGDLIKSARQRTRVSVPASQVIGHIDEASKLLDFDGAVLREFCAIESGVSLTQVENRVPTNLVNGSFRGIFQMGPAAWKDATNVLSKLGFELLPYEIGAFDARSNTFAMVALAKSNFMHFKRRLPDVSIKPTAAILYGCHNQGVTGFLRFIRDQKMIGKQSGKAKELIVAGREQVLAAVGQNKIALFNALQLV